MMPIHYRLARCADAAALAAIYAPYVRDSVVTFETDVPDAGEFARRIERIGSAYPWLLAEADGEAVGYAYAGEYRTRRAYRWSVEVTVYLADAARRRGIGRGLYARLFALLRAQGYVNAYGVVTLPNAASVGLHEAMGFVPIGVHRHTGYKHGAWHDVGWWQLTLREPPGRPDEPLPLPRLDEAIVRQSLIG